MTGIKSVALMAAELGELWMGRDQWDTAQSVVLGYEGYFQLGDVVTKTSGQWKLLKFVGDDAQDFIAKANLGFPPGALRKAMEKRRKRMVDDGMKTKYFVLNPSSSDPIHAAASHAAMLAYADYLENEAGHVKTAQEIVEWATTQFAEG